MKLIYLIEYLEDKHLLQLAILEIINVQVALKRKWYFEFQATEVIPQLKKLEGKKNVPDPEIRELFAYHVHMIFNHYIELKEEEGSLGNYIKAIAILNDELNYQSETILGYAGLTKLLPAFVKIINDIDAPMPGKYGEAVMRARISNKEANGKKPLVQVTCDAERDFVLLIIIYLEKLFQEENSPVFKSKSLRVAIVAANKLNAVNALIDMLLDLVIIYEAI